MISLRDGMGSGCDGKFFRRRRRRRRRPQNVRFLRKKKALAGTLVAKPDFFEEKKAPAGTLVAKPNCLRKKKAPAGTLVAKPEILIKKKKPLRARWWRFRDFKKKNAHEATPTRQRPRGNAKFN